MFTAILAAALCGQFTVEPGFTVVAAVEQHKAKKAEPKGCECQAVKACECGNLAQRVAELEAVVAKLRGQLVQAKAPAPTPSPQMKPPATTRPVQVAPTQAPRVFYYTVPVPSCSNGACRRR